MPPKRERHWGMRSLALWRFRWPNSFRALSNGGVDNTTVILLRIHEST